MNKKTKKITGPGQVLLEETSSPLGSGEETKGAAKITKLDIGCGTNKAPGFYGMDQRAFPGVDIVHDINQYPWPIESDSLDEVHCSHFLEHLNHDSDSPQRVQFMNELYRVLKMGGKATIITPHWASNRAYGDFTHANKPVSEMFYYYINKEWRRVNAPDNDIEWNPKGYNCNFSATWGYSMREDIAQRNSEYQQFAMANYKEACNDIVATVVKIA